MIGPSTLPARCRQGGGLGRQPGVGQGLLLLPQQAVSLLILMPSVHPSTPAMPSPPTPPHPSSAGGHHRPDCGLAVCAHRRVLIGRPPGPGPGLPVRPGELWLRLHETWHGWLLLVGAMLRLPTGRLVGWHRALPSVSPSHLLQTMAMMSMPQIGLVFRCNKGQRQLCLLMPVCRCLQCARPHPSPTSLPLPGPLQQQTYLLQAAGRALLCAL